MQTKKDYFSKTQKQIHRQITFIYEHLIKLGYPKMLQISLTKFQDIQEYLAAYFQSTPGRMHLIQWLIAIVFPQYRQMPWYITQKDQINKLVKCLWKVAVMPVNKHTKNLDYKKYVQATLGYENAVNLIYNLTELAYETVLSKKAKNDVSFGQFFHELIENFTELVNENYDVYGITFPSKFININNENNNYARNDEEKDQYLSQFQKQYEQFYKQKMQPLLERQDEIFDKIYAKNNKTKATTQLQISLKKTIFQNQQQPNTLNDIQKFVDEFSKYGHQYSQKYNKLVDKIDELVSRTQTKNKLIPYFIQKSQQKQNPQNKLSIQESIQKRSIRITPEFCKKYTNYKNLLKKIKHSKDDQQFMSRRTNLLTQIQIINEQVCL